MEYQKITNLLDNGVSLNASNQPSKFRTKNWVEQMMNQDEGIILIVILKLKLQCLGLVYVIMLMHIYLLREQ